MGTKPKQRVLLLTGHLRLGFLASHFPVSAARVLTDTPDPGPQFRKRQMTYPLSMWTPKFCGITSR